MFDWIKRNIKKRLRDGLDEWRDPQGEDNPMACPEITIEGIDSDLYNKLLQEAVAGGAHFGGPTVEIDGLEFDWFYDGPTQSLHITCIKKPFYITCSIVESKIRELIERSKGAI